MQLHESICYTKGANCWKRNYNNDHDIDSNSEHSSIRQTIASKNKGEKMTKKLIYLLVIVSFMAALIASGASAKSQNVLDPNTQFYVPKVNKGATEQIADLTSSGRKADANLI